MRTMKRVAAIAFALMLLAAGAAQAETLSLNGTVEAGVTVPVYAPIGGTVENVSVETGMHVAAGDILFSYRTEKTYAAEDGKVTGVFAMAGDDAETVTAQYGADLYIEGTTRYTVSASSTKAYSSLETMMVHNGEVVYLICRTDATREGKGIITAIDGTNYTVLVTDGEFMSGDSVAVYRDRLYSEKQRVGRGTIARVNPTAVTGTGAIVSVAVQDGDTVKRGDLLMETLSGTFEGYEMTGTAVAATEEGVVVSVSAEVGGTVSKGDVVAKIAPISGMRVEVTVSADDRQSLKAGEKVQIELEADESITYEGTVRYISEMPEEGAEETCYKAVIDFAPDENVFFGMAVVVTAGADAGADAGMDAGKEAE